MATDLDRRFARMTTLLLLGMSIAFAGCTDDGNAGDDGTTEGETPKSMFGRQEKWYLHETGACENTEDQEFFMDKSNSGGDADFCGTFGAAPNGWEFSYPSTLESTGHAQGAAVAVSLFIQGANPGPITVHWELLAASDVVASGTIEGTSSGPAAFVEMTDESTLDSQIDENTSLTFSFHVPVAGGVVRGYEGDHTSMFTLG